jgi:hypothetical protein
MPITQSVAITNTSAQQRAEAVKCSETILFLDFGSGYLAFSKATADHLFATAGY